MKLNLFYFSILLFFQFFNIEKNQAVSSLRIAMQPSSIAKTDTIEDQYDPFEYYTPNKSEEKRLRNMATLTFVFAATSIITLGLTYIAAMILGIAVFIKAKDYRDRLRFLDKSDELYESHKKIANLSIAAFITALFPFFFTLFIILLVGASESSNVGFITLAGTVGLLTFLLFERIVFKTNKVE